jgi:hypothetical protein
MCTLNLSVNHGKPKIFTGTPASSNNKNGRDEVAR